MCLSNVYRNEKAKENLLASDIALIEIAGKEINLTDLFGRRTTVTGSLLRADLTGGTVILRVEE